MFERLSNSVSLFCGDCIAALAEMEAESVDSVVCDPPYHLTSIVKRFGAENAAPAKSAAQRRFENTGGADLMPGTDQFGRLSKGFMGKIWDGGDIAFRHETWAAVMRVMKPGAHLVAFGAPKNYHRLACAIEDAGFEIRDCLMFLFATGFPKSLDISKQIDKAAGAKRERIGTKVELGIRHNPGRENETSPGWARPWRDDPDADGHWVTKPATDAAKQWDGWGTALKPAWEPILLARKPLSEKTVAANVLRWGTGAINVDGCRVGTSDVIETSRNVALGSSSGGIYGKANKSAVFVGNEAGRWPANICHDGSDEVVGMFPETVSNSTGKGMTIVGIGFHGGASGKEVGSYPGSDGSAARFFYTAKADADDRLGSKHPTIKPVDLMQWLCRLVCQKDGTILDPFAGTGTTGEAAAREGMHAVLIEREPEYQNDIRRRISLLMAGPDERIRESVKASGKTADAGPLFAPREAAE